MRALSTLLLAAGLATACSVQNTHVTKMDGRTYDAATRALTLHCRESSMGYCDFKVVHGGTTEQVMVASGKDAVLPNIPANATFCSTSSDGSKQPSLDTCEQRPIT